MFVEPFTCVPLKKFIITHKNAALTVANEWGKDKHTLWKKRLSDSALAPI